MELSERGKLILILLFELGLLSLLSESLLMKAASVCVASVMGFEGANLWWRAHRLDMSATCTLEKKTLLQRSSTKVSFLLQAKGKDVRPLLHFETSQGLALDDSEPMRVEICKDKGVEVSYALTGKKRGTWALGRLVFVLEDALGLFIWRKIWKLDETIEVHISMGGEPLRSEGMGGIRRRRKRAVGGLGTRRWTPEMGEARRFSPGDSLKWVDWKLTARAQKPMVKPPSTLPENQLLLLLDVSKSMETKKGLLLEAALDGCSIVYGVCNVNNIPLAMLAFKGSKPIQYISTGVGKQHELQMSRQLSHINEEVGEKSTCPLLTTGELSQLKRFVLSSSHHDPEVAYFLDRIQPFVESMKIWKDLGRLELYQAMTKLLKKGGLATKVVVLTSLQLETTPLLESLRLAKYNGFELMLAALSPKLAGYTDENELRIFKEKVRIFSVIPDIKILEIESMGELAQLSSIVG